MSIGTDLGFLARRNYNLPDARLVLPTCLLGLEFEFENVQRMPDDDVHEWAEFFDVKEDHSLRGVAREFVFDRPLLGEDALFAITGLLAFANETGYSVGLRTGLHVHVDIRDLEYPQLRTMLLLSALLDPALYHYAGDNREENVFCLPWYVAEQAAVDAREVFLSEGQALRRAASNINNRKYAGINLDPISRFGSIEYRHLRCTRDFDRILAWINVLLRIKEFSQLYKGNHLDLVGASGQLDFWHGVLKGQMATLAYPEFLQDLRTKSLPVVDQILTGPLPPPPLGQENVKVTNYLEEKSRRRETAAGGRVGLLAPFGRFVAEFEAFGDPPDLTGTAMQPARVAPRPAIITERDPEAELLLTDHRAMLLQVRRTFLDFCFDNNVTTPPIQTPAGFVFLAGRGQEYRAQCRARLILLARAILNGVTRMLIDTVAAEPNPQRWIHEHLTDRQMQAFSSYAEG